MEEPTDRSEFELQAAESRQGFIAEFWDFLAHHKKWWLLPIVIVLLGVGALALLSGTAVGPFIYTLF